MTGESDHSFSLTAPVEFSGSVSHHIGAFLGPGEGERRVSRPLAVQSDVGVHVHRDRPGLHHQDGTN